VIRQDEQLCPRQCRCCGPLRADGRPGLDFEQRDRQLRERSGRRGSSRRRAGRWEGLCQVVEPNRTARCKLVKPLQRLRLGGDRVHGPTAGLASIGVSRSNAIASVASGDEHRHASSGWRAHRFNANSSESRRMKHRAGKIASRRQARTPRRREPPLRSQRRGLGHRGRPAGGDRGPTHFTAARWYATQESSPIVASAAGSAA
jgi:hypothetical protein